MDAPAGTQGAASGISGFARKQAKDGRRMPAVFRLSLQSHQFRKRRPAVERLDERAARLLVDITFRIERGQMPREAEHVVRLRQAIVVAFAGKDYCSSIHTPSGVFTA